MANSFQPVRVLIVDPDAPSARLLRATLAGEGYELDIAATGADALSKISIAVPRVLLLELALPDMSGFDLVARLRGELATRDIVVVVVTNKSGHEVETTARRAGAAGYVRKPIDPIAFSALVGSVLERNR